MSEEEKKAIDTLKEVASDDFDTLGDDISPKMVQNILNIINNQQKEIKKEKSRIMELAELLDKQENEIKFLKVELEIQEGCSISKDKKIREKIKEYQEKAEDVKQKYKGVYAYKDDYLEALAKIEGYQELLEENKNE